jgi:predicted nucleic acid-binding protein
VKIVVDTNVVFSTLLNTNSNIAGILFNSDGCFEFYACSYMRQEIRRHWHKLISISKLSEEQLELSYALVLSKLHFINEEIIPLKIWESAENMVSLIDEDDIDFVALTIFINATLWTGDKPLYLHLKKLSFPTVNVSEMLEIRSKRLG